MESRNMDKYVIYDRAVQIKGQENIADFLNDPRGYLEKIGALDGISEFNGFVDSEDKRIDSLEDYHKDGSRPSRAIYIEHLGVPYDYPYFCTWQYARYD